MKRDGRDSYDRRHKRPVMSLGEAFLILGLPLGTERSVVHSTYRRLALKYHPDRNPGDAKCLERFKQLAVAYRTIEKKFWLDRSNLDQAHDECDRCGEYAIVHKALDGTLCCAECLSMENRRPLLPAPSITIVTCATTIVLLALAVGCLAAGWVVGGAGYLLAALLLGTAALIALGVTCATVVYTADPRALARRRSVQTVRARRPAHSAKPAQSVP